MKGTKYDDPLLDRVLHGGSRPTPTKAEMLATPYEDIGLCLRDMINAPGMNSITTPDYVVRVAAWLDKAPEALAPDAAAVSNLLKEAVLAAIREWNGSNHKLTLSESTYLAEHVMGSLGVALNDSPGAVKHLRVRWEDALAHVRAALAAHPVAGGVPAEPFAWVDVEEWAAGSPMEDCFFRVEEDKPNDDAVLSPLYLAAPVEVLGEQATRCEYCDGTGDVVNQIGEWRGTCTMCDAAPPAKAELPGLLARLRAEIDHAVRNDQRLPPEFGKRKGPLVVRAGLLRALMKHLKDAK